MRISNKLLLGVFTILMTGVVACETGQPNQKGGMEAEATIFPGGADITNLNDFPWYGLTLTLNDNYSNRLLLDKGNWPFLRHDSVVLQGDVEVVIFEGNFVKSDDEFLDHDDTWWKNIPYTITVEKIRLEAKSEVDGSYDLGCVDNCIKLGACQHLN